MTALLFALVSETKAVRPRDLYWVAKGAQVNAAHCAEGWSKEPPVVTVFDSHEKLPRGVRCQPIVVVDESSDPGILAEHYVDAWWGPVARAYAANASGVLTGDESLSEAICHEVCEALVDPLVNLWDDDGYALEVCDATQTTYPVRVWGWKGMTEVPVANFVTMAWFDRSLEDIRTRNTFLAGGGRFDYTSELPGPFAIGPYGYAIWRGPHGVETLWGARRSLSARRRAAVAHPWSRTMTRTRRAMEQRP